MASYIQNKKQLCCSDKKKKQLDNMQALESQSLVDCLLYIRRNDPKSACNIQYTGMLDICIRLRENSLSVLKDMD